MPLMSLEIPHLTWHIITKILMPDYTKTRNAKIWGKDTSYEKSSLLNYVRHVLSYPTWLVPYLLSCLTCFMVYVPSCLMCFVPYVLLCLLCLMSRMPCALRALVSYVLLLLMCPWCLVPCVFHVSISPLCSCFPMLCVTFSYLFPTRELFWETYYN